MERVTVRSADIYDIDEIMNVQRQCYDHGLIENDDIFKEILSRGMSLVTECDGKIIGFLVAHMSRRDQVHLLHHKPAKVFSDVVFIHDMSILPAYWRRGIGKAMMMHFEKTLRENLHLVQLIAVNGADMFWKKLGFQQRDDIYLSPDVLQNYGGLCTFMQKQF